MSRITGGAMEREMSDSEQEKRIGPPDRRQKCNDHLNCMYRIELLEKAHELIWKKIDHAQRLLIANLAGICTLLLSTLIGVVIWISQH